MAAQTSLLCDVHGVHTDLSFSLAFTVEILLRIIVVSETLEHFWWYCE
jgi:hypothetical protein